MSEADVGSSLENTEQYTVVRNHEDQYSVWRADRELPAGWQAVGAARSRDQCLEDIERLWTDMRPLSLRTFLASS